MIGIRLNPPSRPAASFPCCHHPLRTRLDVRPIADLDPTPQAFPHTHTQINARYQTNNRTKQPQPFGAGPRLCIGYKLAMQEAVQTVVRLFQRFDFEVDETMNGGGPPRLRPGITLGYRDGMWCRVRERGGAAAAR
jgi:hypothetical protein